jgi:hypothetical protein
MQSTDWWWMGVRRRLMDPGADEDRMVQNCGTRLSIGELTDTFAENREM